jgi:hypothetical protein
MVFQLNARAGRPPAATPVTLAATPTATPTPAIGVTLATHAPPTGAAVQLTSSPLPTAIANKLDVPNDFVRRSAIETLSGVLPEEPELRAVIIAKLDDPSDSVRSAAIRALSGLLPEEPELRAAITAKLDDPEWIVRRVAVEALLPLLPRQPALLTDLMPWLGCTFEPNPGASADLRRKVAASLAPLVAQDAQLMAEVAALLESPAWPIRQGAAWVLIGMPGGPPASLLPRLKGCSPIIALRKAGRSGCRSPRFC